MKTTWLALLLACSDKGDDSNAESDADTDADADTDTDTDTGPVCTKLSSATDWTWDGTCPGMLTPCDIVVKDCALTIDYAADGGMTMGMPFSGTIDGKTITFADDNALVGCVGTIKDPDHVEGTCTNGSGCAFLLYRTGS
jgi:hypothetical protein